MTPSALEVSRVRDRSVVTRARSVAPLRLLSSAGTGDAAWVYQSSLGGGFVGRDDLALRVDVSPAASLFLSSQASTKVYRGARSHFSVDAAVHAGATLVSWPDPVVCFAGAGFTQAQRFALAPDATLLAVDAWTAGRLARGERYAFDRLDTTLSLSIAGATVLTDATLLSPAHGDLAARMGPVNAFATVVLAGPRLPCDRLAATIAAARLAFPLVTASRWPWGLVVRAGATSAEQLHATLHHLLAPAAIDLLGADPFARKW